MIKLIAIDIDGTLLNSQHQVPERHRQALAEAAASGIVITLATGRSTHFTRPLAQSLGIPVALLVNNGAVVERPDGTIAVRSLLEKEVAREILDRMGTYQDSVALVFDRPASDETGQIAFEHMDWTHANRRGYYERAKAFIRKVSPLASALVEDPIEVMYTGGVRPMRELADELRQLPISNRFSVAVTEYEQRDFTLIDINAPGCSKGSALARWAALLDLARDEVMAVGDNWNDLEMLAFAGTGIVMGNAAEALKERGFHMTASNDEDGLADAIHRFALAPARGNEAPGEVSGHNRSFGR